MHHTSLSLHKFFFIVTHRKTFQTNLPYSRTLKISTTRSDLNEFFKKNKVSLMSTMMKECIISLWTQFPMTEST